MAVYIVFDVETPNRANDRMSAIGITAIKDNKIVANYFSLVDPETHFDSFNTQLTGIDADPASGLRHRRDHRADGHGRGCSLSESDRKEAGACVDPCKLQACVKTIQK